MYVQDTDTVNMHVFCIVAVFQTLIVTGLCSRSEQWAGHGVWSNSLIVRWSDGLVVCVWSDGQSLV